MESNTDLLKMLIERTSYINTYWNFYIIVATAVIGTIASGKINVTHSIRVILTCAFVLFALSNLQAIICVNKQRTALSNLVPDSFSTITETLRPNNNFRYIAFHLLLDISVLLAVWRIK